MEMIYSGLKEEKKLKTQSITIAHVSPDTHIFQMRQTEPHCSNKTTCLGAICVLLLSTVIPATEAFPSQNEKASPEEKPSSPNRKDKALNFANLELFANVDYNNLADDIETVYYDQLGTDSLKTFNSGYNGVPEDTQLAANEDLSRSRPSTIRGDGNSPIYYIRLPPTPYMFVPGVGYVSQPPNLRLPPVVQNPGQSPIVNVPINFMSNGKPTSIYTLPNEKPVWQKPITHSKPSWAAPQVTQQTPTSWQNSWQQNQHTSWPVAPQNTIKPAQYPTNVDSNLIYLNKGPYTFNGRPTDVFYMSQYDTLYSDSLQSFYP